MAHELSQKNTRKRLNRHIKIDEIRRDVNMLKPVEDWDWEELQRGYPRAASGRFGPRPVWADLFQTDEELQRRLKRMSLGKLRAYAGNAMDTIMELLTDDSVDLDGKPTVPAAVRLKAAEYILDQTIGKATSVVEVEAGDSLRNFLADCLVNDDNEDAHPMIVPGEILDEEVEDL